MRSPRRFVAALVLLTLGFCGALPLAGQDVVQGERLDPATYGPSYIESMEAAIERDRFATPPRNEKERQPGEQGVWMVPSRDATRNPHSGAHYAVNKWGDTRMGIGFPQVVTVTGAYFFGQGGEGVWTPALRVVGYRAGQLVCESEWQRNIGAEPEWFALHLTDVDRIEIISTPVFRGGGWYALDDLTYVNSGDGQQVVVDFDDLGYGTKLTGSTYAGLTWETGSGDFEQEGVPAPLAPPGIRPPPLPTDQLPQASPTARSQPPQLLASYQGVLRGDAGSFSYPPDTIGAIGPNHYVETVNRNFAVYDKATGAQLTNILLGSFLPGSNGDPRVLYDQHSGRFFVIVTDFNATATIFIAVTLTSDPMGSWFKTSFVTAQGSDTGKWPDYPTLGVDFYGIYTAAYMVGGGMSIFAIDKAPLIASPPSLGTITAFRDLPWEGAIQPAHTFGWAEGEYLVSWASSSSLRIRRINPPLTAPTLTQVGIVTVPPFSAPPNAPALGSSVPLNTVDERLMMSVYRNGSLWSAHTINVSGRAACRWYELNASGATLIQSGNVADSSLYYFFPGLSVNAYGHVVMGFTGSNASQYAGCYYTGRLASDPPGTMSAVVQYKAGTGPQNNIDSYGRNRWGDYSYTTVDPLDDSTFWTIQEYGHATDIWGTYIGVLTQGPTPPHALNVSVTTANSVPVAVTLQAADDGNPDPPGALSYIIASLPGHGALHDPAAGPITTVPYTLVNNGVQVEYAPTPGYEGTDTFTYRANDGGSPPEGGDSNLATVTATVGGAFWDPVALDGQAQTAVNVPVAITLVGSDPNHDPLTYVIESLPHAGLLVDAGAPEAGPITTVPYTLVNGGRVVTYLPPCQLSPTTSFTFSVHDATASSNIATVTVTVSASAPQKVRDYKLDADPGWTVQGAWGFGQPSGGGSHNHDPLAGYTGANVYGYNLAGDYANNLPARYLTTAAFNCSNMTHVELRFRRWLGVERFDHATVEASNDGVNWTTLWDSFGTEISQSSWSTMTLDVSAIADAQPAVYIRWGMGPTDQSVTFPGWNIDDIELWAVVGVLPADFNADGLVDFADATIMSACLGGPNEGLDLACRCVDLDADGDVDLADVGTFQAMFGE